MGWRPSHRPGHRTRPVRPRDRQPAGRRAAPRRYLLSSGNWSSSAILNEPRRFFKGCPPRCIVGRRLSAREVRMRSSRPAAPAPARPPAPPEPAWRGPPGLRLHPGPGWKEGRGGRAERPGRGRARGARRQPRCARPRHPPRLPALAPGARPALRLRELQAVCFLRGAGGRPGRVVRRTRPGFLVALHGGGCARSNVCSAPQTAFLRRLCPSLPPQPQVLRPRRPRRLQVTDAGSRAALAGT